MTHSAQKSNGVFYTPNYIVNLILDNVLPPSAHELTNATICDPACGDGAFLVQVAQRILDKLERHKALTVLSRLTGYDVDTNAVSQCKGRLNEVLHRYYPDELIDWNIVYRDALDRKAFTEACGAFTHIVGNPPYVRVQHLEKVRRAKCVGQWKTLRGATDLYILFYELALDLLCEGGVVGYITPSSWTRSDAGKLLRKMLWESHRVVKIIDFGEHQVFSNVTTYTSITVIQKQKSAQSVPAEKWDGERLLSGGQVVVDRNKPEKKWWIAKSKAIASRMDELMERGPVLGDIADIHVGIQTLADSIFIVPIDKARKLGWESWILKDIVKVSVIKNGEDSIKRVIIFPYDESGVLFPESIVADKAPSVYHWLLSHKDRLMMRDKGGVNPAKWYAFGRQVSIKSGFGDKILTSGMNKKPNFQRCLNPKATFYSGYCIKPRPWIDIEYLLSALNSSDMDFFIRHTSKPYQGGWMSYAKSFIKNFPVQPTTHLRLL